jgi:hypothetical protein
MKKAALYVSVFFFMFLSYFISPSHAGETQKNTCVSCHSNDGSLKALFTPPNVQVSEGEG